MGFVGFSTSCALAQLLLLTCECTAPTFLAAPLRGKDLLNVQLQEIEEDHQDLEQTISQLMALGSQLLHVLRRGRC